MKAIELNMKEICERLNEVKQIRKLSNQDIAQAGGTTAQTINILLKGEIKKPNMSILSNICKGLQVDSDWLLYGNGKKVSVLQVGNTNFTSDTVTEQMYREALERISELKANLDNTNYTIRLQREVMRNAGLHFRVVTEDRPPLQNECRIVVLLEKSKKQVHLQSA